MADRKDLKPHSPSTSVTLSVKARDARMRTLSLSSYFIFISKKPTEDAQDLEEALTPVPGNSLQDSPS